MTKKENAGAQSSFWADKLASEIINRKNFTYSDKAVPKLKRFAVKSSFSASGVLHIGRLSDTIRNEAVVRALIDAGKKAHLIMTADDMDALRKIPPGIADGYVGYIGAPVTDIPDQAGCHESYAEHHVGRYLDIVKNFISVPVKTFSMREEYRKGTFRPYIKKLLQNFAIIVEIQNKYRTTPLKPGWAPWRPVCAACGKIITPQVTAIDAENSTVDYVCRDYEFEKTLAKGCGHKGTANALKDAGKLMYKSEWAAQWAHWQIVAETEGKEYQVPGSAFWINAEIVERVLDWPAPLPVFFEHLMIDGKKMSASLGNVVYPQDWLTVAPAELLRYFYNKRLMKTRSFSWADLPEFYHEYDESAGVFFGKYKIPNKKEEAHTKRLYEISQLKKIQKMNPMPFSHAVTLAQTTADEKKIIEALKRTQHYDKAAHKEILARLAAARIWVEKYAPEQYKFVVRDNVLPEIRSKLSQPQLAALKTLAAALDEKVWKEEELHSEFKHIAAQQKLEPIDFFRAAYLVILGKEKGPPLANFILTVGQERVARILRNL